MRQARRERNEAEKLMKEEEIKEDEKRGRRAAAIATREEKKKEREQAVEEFHRVMGQAEEEEKVEKDLSLLSTVRSIQMRQTLRFRRNLSASRSLTTVRRTSLDSSFRTWLKLPEKNQGSL